MKNCFGSLTSFVVLTLFLSACNKNTPPTSSTATNTGAQQEITASANTEPAASATDKPAEKVEWLTIEQAAALMKTEKRKVVIDVYTDWCGWCKKMDKDTFTDPKVAALINKYYYPVKLDAEGKVPITLNGHTYTFKPEYKSHELAVALLQGQMSFPTTVYLDENFNMLAPVPGYLDAKNFAKILRYFGENHHKSMNFQEFEKM
ncbi:thioredoxin family protein [Pontibacter sp. MBLB2868]|uniref:thioredoxin family protein n=1 Tax=Pontibacter sp. MBLB2868 TaxID=3451555 RepID=UPI003F74F7EE